MDDQPVVGIVPVEGRGSLPFALLQGDSLVAIASWALGEAGVELLDFTASWEEVQERDAALVVHDPLCPGTPVDFLEAAVAAAADGSVVVGVRPVTDTVKHADGAVLGETVDRSGLVAVCSPVVLPAAVVRALPAHPDTDDLADLVVTLSADHPVAHLEAPPSARRVVDESDVRVLEGLLAGDG
ncbi:MAG: hypothetical protein HOQ22_04490 [Nocardioidaceae bacterium]|nr:hypothetical protein [Nocardioidaceae bacterium]NUS50286.1 hypothetical protein [Nocardioidaceae bacterium]